MNEFLSGRDCGDEDDIRANWLQMTSGSVGDMFSVRFYWCSVHGWVNERFIYLHRTHHTGTTTDTMR